MKAARIRTKSGEVRICGLGPAPNLPAWWMEARALGCIVGENWGMPFSEVALVDLIEIEPQPSTLHGNKEVEQAAQAIAAGQWKPPGSFSA